LTRAGGGGGGNNTVSQTPASGGSGGGGVGATDDPGESAGVGTVNTGSGGGGGATIQPGGNGGSGVVILRYPADLTITIGAGLTGTTATVGSNKVTTITQGTGNVSWAA
jgi:hypothetical protein